MATFSPIVSYVLIASCLIFPDYISFATLCWLSYGDDEASSSVSIGDHDISFPLIDFPTSHSVEMYFLKQVTEKNV